MNLNPKFSRRLRKVTSSLILTLTNFKENSENHELCMDFSLSNFCHHRFLNVDSHKIEQQIKGLSNKFWIYSQPSKSKIFKELCAKFLACDLSPNTCSGGSVHYGLISILLLLAKNPISETYSQASQTISKIESHDDFDWPGYLLEGEDILSYFPWDDSQIDSDTEENSVSTLAFMDNKTAKNNQDQHNQVGLKKEGTQLTILPANVVNTYWQRRKTLSSLDLRNICSLKSPQSSLEEESHRISEINIMREVLWLLSGHENLFVFNFKNGEYHLSEDLQLAHISHDSVKHSLKDFVRRGNIVKRIHQFCFSKDSHACLTYQAFAACLIAYKEKLQQDLQLLEQKMISQQETILLPDLHIALAAHIQILGVLHDVFEYSVKLDKVEEKNAVKASRLLNVLYASVLDEESVAVQQPCDVLTAADVVFNMWLESCRPYIDIVDKWITMGILDDTKQEFILQRSVAVTNCQDAEFWQKAVTVMTENVDQLLPWLCSFLNSISTAGKSMEVLHTINKLNRSSEGVKIHQGGFDNTFTSVYQSFYGGMTNTSPTTNYKPTENQRADVLHGILGKEALLQYNFLKLFKSNAQTNEDHSLRKHKNDRTPLPIRILKSLCPILQVKCSQASMELLDVFKTRFGLQKVLDVFHNFHLMGWGDVMHYFCTQIFEQLLQTSKLNDDIVGLNILLQESMIGRSMDNFMITVTINSGIGHRQETGLLSVQSDKDKAFSYNLVSVTDALELQYPIEWPICMVLSPQCICTYNKMFSYLMQIKRAVFCVETLQFSSLYRHETNTETTTSMTAEPDDMTVGVKAHKLFLLRSRILHVLQHWYGFVMNSVIQAEKHRFSNSMKQVQTLDDILTAHQVFLDRICMLCLLDEKKQPGGKLVQGTIKKIMTLAITFNMLWKRGVSSIHSKNILKFESDFKECSEFLAQILKTVASRGAVPILDSLAYALLS
ncbi:unnamed protein product [Clavelina lepadiformis]|uniref:Gamma-tubulin complex component n=1 Tax=Clavelina lepadiformis TaxID=159417 RepID=A0ABP0FEP2_CLALP